jgi:hypothetical protein
MEGIVEKIGVFGVVLLALAVLIGVGFGVFSIARNTANEGVVGVQDALGSMNESVFNDFDQKTLSGTQVLSAYNTMNGKPIAIIVKTCKGEWVNYNALITPFSQTSPKQLGAPFQNMSREALSKQYTVSTSFFDKTSAGIELAHVMSDGGGDVSKKIVLFNSVTTDMTKSGNQNYVTSTAKFSSYLVKDAGDTIIGIVFIQQGKHTMGT